MRFSPFERDDNVCRPYRSRTFRTGWNGLTFGAAVSDALAWFFAAPSAQAMPADSPSNPYEPDDLRGVPDAKLPPIRIGWAYPDVVRDLIDHDLITEFCSDNTGSWNFDPDDVGTWDVFSLIPVELLDLDRFTPCCGMLNPEKSIPPCKERGRS